MKLVTIDPQSQIRYTHIDSPVGPLLLIGAVSDSAFALVGISMQEQAHAPEVGIGWLRDDFVFGEVIAQLEQYFTGDRTTFDLTIGIDHQGTEFQSAVWRALTDIPYGQTASYADVAASVGRPRATRAVGSANGRNPLAIVIPCHRVVAASGGLGGYGGGLDRKELLLDLEASHHQA
ncbi:MAG: methylated-DNA--[protein]-cysteine S-methyltransferase [Candidatus Nanopelagicales bacterium]